jgi:hypothetical protein
VFGTSFNDAVARTKTLVYTDKITVAEDTLEGLGLLDLFEGDVDIGKAELELLISSLRIVKATFEWLDAYDWNTDLSLLTKFDWDDYEAFKTELAAMDPSKLPLRNNFLKNRNNGKMDASKASYVLAIEIMISAYDHIADGMPPAVGDFKDDYKWIEGGLTALKTAIKDGKTFWIPKTLPSGDTWNVTETNSSFGINMEKLFNPGQLSLDKLITLETGSSKVSPQFYKDDGTPITAKNQIGTQSIGFELKTGPVKEIVKGLDTELTDQKVSLVPPEIAEILWDLYHQ